MREVLERLDFVLAFLERAPLRDQRFDACARLLRHAVLGEDRGEFAELVALRARVATQLLDGALLREHAPVLRRGHFERMTDRLELRDVLERERADRKSVV